MYFFFTSSVRLRWIIAFIETNVAFNTALASNNYSDVLDEFVHRVCSVWILAGYLIAYVENFIWKVLRRLLGFWIWYVVGNVQLSSIEYTYNNVIFLILVKFLYRGSIGSVGCLEFGVGFLFRLDSLSDGCWQTDHCHAESKIPCTINVILPFVTESCSKKYGLKLCRQSFQSFLC